MSSIAEKREQLLDVLKSLGSCAVAFSGGVDSAVVAKAARLALADQALAVTGVSASLASGELEQAKEVAHLIGIRHVMLSTDEFASASYRANNPDRCYHCKTELYLRMEGLAERLGVASIVNGTNADDLGDYRPGLKAAAEHQVRSPLAECNIGKQEVRALAADWQLPVWDKPASPCLSSRVAYGEAVTPERLKMIDQGEQFLREMGFQLVRVRYHRNDLARIEISAVDLAKLCEPGSRERLLKHFHAMGFKFITLDLEGFRSGSLNAIVPLVIAN